MSGPLKSKLKYEGQLIPQGCFNFAYLHVMSFVCTVWSEHQSFFPVLLKFNLRSGAVIPIYLGLVILKAIWGLIFKCYSALRVKDCSKMGRRPK